MAVFNEALQEFDGGNFGRALTLLRDTLAADPGNATAQRLLAATCLQLERFDEAQSAARRYVQLRPDDAAGYQQLGQVYLRQQRIDEARESFERALQRDPLNAEAKKDLQKLSWRGSEATNGRDSAPPSITPLALSAAEGSPRTPASDRHPVTPSSSWHPRVIKSAVVIAAIAIAAVAFLPQWLGSRGTHADPNAPQRTIVAQKPPEVAKSQRPSPQPQQRNPAASSINEQIPLAPPQPSPEELAAAERMRQQQLQAQNQGKNQNAEDQGGDGNAGRQSGTNAGNRGKGKGGGSGAGTKCPACGGKGWIDCPGPIGVDLDNPASYIAQALGAATGAVVGGNRRDICRNGTYYCPNHVLDRDLGDCKNCGQSSAQGRCPVCNGTGRKRCASCDLISAMGGMGKLNEMANQSKPN